MEDDWQEERQMSNASSRSTNDYIPNEGSSDDCLKWLPRGADSVQESIIGDKKNVIGESQITRIEVSSADTRCRGGVEEADQKKNDGKSQSSLFTHIPVITERGRGSAAYAIIDHGTQPTKSENKDGTQREEECFCCPKQSTDGEMNKNDFTSFTSRTRVNKSKKASHFSAARQRTIVSASSHSSSLAILSDETKCCTNNHQNIVTYHKEPCKRSIGRTKVQSSCAAPPPDQPSTTEFQKERATTIAIERDTNSRVSGTRWNTNPSRGRMTQCDRGDDSQLAIGSIATRKEWTSKPSANHLSTISHHSLSSCSNTERENLIKMPGPDDILMGRGRPYHVHIGNRKMVQLVEKHRKRYDDTPRHKRRAVGEAVVDEILKNGGRFLKKVGEWTTKVTNSDQTRDVDVVPHCCHFSNITRTRQYYHILSSIAAASICGSVSSSVGADGTSADDYRKVGRKHSVTRNDDNSDGIFWTEVSREIAFQKVTHLLRDKRYDTTKERRPSRRMRGEQNLSSMAACCATLTNNFVPSPRAALIRPAPWQTDAKRSRTDEKTLLDHESVMNSEHKPPSMEEKLHKNDVAHHDLLQHRWIRGKESVSLPLPVQTVAASDFFKVLHPCIRFPLTNQSTFVQNAMDTSTSLQIVGQQLHHWNDGQIEQQTNIDGAKDRELRESIAAKKKRKSIPRASSFSQDEFMRAILSANGDRRGPHDDFTIRRVHHYHQEQPQQPDGNWNALPIIVLQEGKLRHPKISTAVAYPNACYHLNITTDHDDAVLQQDNVKREQPRRCKSFVVAIKTTAMLQDFHVFQDFRD